MAPIKFEGLRLQYVPTPHFTRIKSSIALRTERNESCTSKHSFRPAVTKAWAENSKRSATNFQGIREYISVMATLGQMFREK